MKKLWFAFAILLAPCVWAQEPAGFVISGAPPIGEGWSGFLNIPFLSKTVATLLLAAVLGAIIAYHPKHMEVADTLEEIDAPKVYILYAVVGGIIGILVAQYSLVVGFVLFGIGGLMRFRTELRSANLTGRLILVTLVGLTAGLDMPHVAVLATIFGFVLIYLLDARIIYRVDVRGLADDRYAESIIAYRSQLESHGCRVYAEKKNPRKQHVAFIFSGPRGMDRAELEARLDSSVEASLSTAMVPPSFCTMP